MYKKTKKKKMEYQDSIEKEKRSERVTEYNKIENDEALKMSKTLSVKNIQTKRKGAITNIENGQLLIFQHENEKIKKTKQKKYRRRKKI